MKIFRILCAALFFVALPVAFVLPGCGTTALSITYKTLYGVEKSTVAAYDAYLDGVLAGQIKTNNLPAISQAFNDFQLSMQAAIAVAQFNTNAPVTPQISAASASILSAITAAKGK